MPLQEFWNDDPDLLWTYRNLYMQKMEDETKLKQEIMNYEAWLQALYIQRAIASNLSKKVRYFEKPIEFNEKPKTKAEQNQLIMERVKAQAMKGQMLLGQRSENEGH